MKHVHADRIALAEHPFQFGGLFRTVGLVVLLAPVIEPARPVFAAHVRTVGPERIEDAKALFGVAGSKIDDRRQFGKRAVGDLLRTVGGVKHIGGQAVLFERLLQRCHVRVVVAEGSVLVLHLDGNDGAAVAHQQRSDLLAKPCEPAIDGRGVFRIVAAQNKASVLQQPRRVASQFPFRADIGTRAKDDVEALLLGFANVLRYVILAAEVIDARTRLVQVPEDVRRDGVEPHGAGLAEAVAPIDAGYAGIMHFPGNDLVGLAVE